MATNDPLYVPPSPPSNDLTALQITGWVFVALLAGLYLLLVVYLVFTMYGMSQVALLFVVLLGSFVFPIILPVLILILLGCGVIHERVRTRVA